MKNVAGGVKLGILVVVVLGLGYLAWKSVGESISGAGAYTLYADFRDAQGLPEESRVVIAGLPVGQIAERTLAGNRARIFMDIKEDVKVYSNAVVFKKSSSLLGEYYLEIDPGTPTGPDGETHELLEDGDQIKYVVEATTADELLRRFNEAMPKVEELLDEVTGLARDIRGIVNTNVKNIAENIDELVEREDERISKILERIDGAMATIQGIASDVRAGTGDGRIERILENVEQLSVDLKDLVATTKGEITQTGQAVRDRLDRIDSAIAEIEDTFRGTASIARKIDEDEGTLGRLVNDPAIADNVEQITDDLASFVNTTFGLQTLVGIRAEYNVLANASKTYFSIELMPRPDKFYLVELVADPQGRGLIDETFILNPETGQLERTTVVEPDIRFSFQFAKILDPFTFRIGIKESTGGVGVDLKLLDGALTLNTDLFDLNFDDMPRLKFWLAYRFFSILYIYAGVDDVLNDPETIPIANPSLTGIEREYHYGRDFFAGAMVKFNDQDLSSLLFIGGAALGAIATSQ